MKNNDDLMYLAVGVEAIAHHPGEVHSVVVDARLLRLPRLQHGCARPLPGRMLRKRLAR